MGATASIPETSRSMAFASSYVRYLWVPLVDIAALSGNTMMKLLPNDAICSSMLLLAPAPTANAAMTAATPIIIPSAVSMERVLFRRSARAAVFTISCEEIILEHPLPVYFVTVDNSVFEVEYAFGIGRYVRFVSDQDYRYTLFI